MVETIEKELKTALNISHYKLLLQYFKVNDNNYHKQFNFYYDTPTQQLRKANVGLRVRVVNGVAEMTIKEPIAKHEKKETTDTFTMPTPQPMVFTNGSVVTLLNEKYGIQLSDLILIGSLVNERYEITTPKGIWAIDKSHFPTGIAYELEFEYEQLQDPFFDLLAQFDIPYIQTKSKLARAIHTKGD